MLCPVEHVQCCAPSTTCSAAPSRPRLELDGPCWTWPSGSCTGRPAQQARRASPTACQIRLPLARLARPAAWGPTWTCPEPVRAQRAPRASTAWASGPAAAPTRSVTPSCRSLPAPPPPLPQQFPGAAPQLPPAPRTWSSTGWQTPLRPSAAGSTTPPSARRCTMAAASQAPPATGSWSSCTRACCCARSECTQPPAAPERRRRGASRSTVPTRRRSLTLPCGTPTGSAVGSGRWCTTACCLPSCCQTTTSTRSTLWMYLPPTWPPSPPTSW